MDSPLTFSQFASILAAALSEQNTEQSKIVKDFLAANWAVLKTW